MLRTNNILQLKSNSFLDTYDPSASEEFALHTRIEGKLVLYEGETCSPTLEWPAQDYPQGHISGYWMVRHCEACIFVYDIGNKASFDAVKWYYKNFSLERSLERRGLCPLSCFPTCTSRPPYEGLLFVIANNIDCEENEWALRGRRVKTSARPLKRLLFQCRPRQLKAVVRIT